MRAALVLLLAILLAGCADDAPARQPTQLPGKGTAFGTLAGAVREADAWNVTMDAVAVDCERNATRWTGLVRVPEMPGPGAVIGVRAGDASLYRTISAYAEACAPAHLGDVRPTGFRTPEDVPARPGVVQQRGIPLVLGSTTRVVAQVEQLQDLPLDIEISNLTVRVSLLPRGGAVLCEVAPSNVTRTVPARTVWNLTLTLACPEDAPVDGPKLAGVYGALAFTDELGHRHERAGALWQFLAPGRDATLSVDPPAPARSADAFEMRARYVDAGGAPIRGATVRAWLDWPDATLPPVTLREEGDAYALRLADAPPPSWPRGERAVHVEAEDPSGRHVWRAARVLVRYG